MREDRTSNEISGTVSGNAIQAGRIEAVHVHAPAPRVTGPSDALPAADLPFIDRVAERSVLGAAADPDGVAIVHVSGLRGSGKTALALYAAQHDLRGFAGRRMYVSLSGTPSLSDTLSALLLGLGVNGEMIPPRFEERRELYVRKTGAVGPILLLLDDVETAAQVKTLRPAAPGSVVIVNSENRLGELVMSGGRLLPLRPLDPSASAELLDRMLAPHGIAAGPAELAEVAELCGHLPLAVRIAAAQLIMGAFPGPGELAAALRGDAGIDVLSAGPEAAMRPVLDAAYDRLPAGAATAYRALAAHPGPDFTEEVAAAALGRPDVRPMLAALRESDLIAPLPGGRYRFHALVGAHARGRAAALDPEPERRARLSRVVAWYAATAARADRTGLAARRWRLIGDEAGPGDQGRSFAGPAEALAWQEAERINALAVVRAAQDAEPETARRALVLCEAFWPLFQTWKYHADWIETDEIGVRIARRLGEAGAEATLTNQLARAHLDLGEPDAAERHLAAGRAVAERAGDPRLPAVLAETAGLIARARGDWEEALARLREARAGNAALGDPRGAALQAYQVGVTLTRAGRPGEAVEELAGARTRLAGIGDPYLSGRVALELGRAYRELGRTEEAVAELTRAAEIMRDRAQPAKELTALDLLSDLAPGGDHATRAAGLRAHLGLP